ncbi:hypothetical protein FB451DRAFT_1175235 [Mycena latifolia]|nr:hypothetical protein FB451DRAFT_1175235 [Mycena latifolia]
MLDAFTKEEEEEMIKEVLEKRKTKLRSTRANNLAAGADMKRTLERMMLEITGLAERAGMIRSAMFTRGHIHDKTIPVTIQSWGALDFFREILKKDPADVAALFELWAVSWEQGDTGTDTLLGMQQDCTSMITSGLHESSSPPLRFANFLFTGMVLGKTKVKMNFENYIKVLVEGKNVGLIDWPKEVEFKRMSKQSKVGPLRILHDALKCGTVRWKVLSTGEKKRLVEQFKDMVENGEAQEKVGKARVKGTRKASSRVSRLRKKKTPRESEDELDDGDHHHHPPPKAKASRMSRTKGKTQADPGEDKGDDDEDTNAPRKAISDMTVEEKRAQLMRLVAKSREASGEGKHGARKSSKRTCEEESSQPRKKAKRKGTEGEGRASGESSKRKRGAEEDEEGGERKKKKTSKELPAPTQPAPVKPRPKPRLKVHAAKTATTTPTAEMPATATPTTNVPAIGTTATTSSTPAISTATANAPVTPATTTTTTADAPATKTPGATTTTSTAKNAAGAPFGEVTNGAAPCSTSASGTSKPKAGKPNMVKGKAGGPPGCLVIFFCFIQIFLGNFLFGMAGVGMPTGLYNTPAK